MSLYLLATDCTMKHNNVDETFPSAVRPDTSPLLYSTLHATYISSMIHKTDCLNSFSFDTCSFRYGKLPTSVELCSFQVTFFEIVVDGK